MYFKNPINYNFTAFFKSCYEGEVNKGKRHGYGIFRSSSGVSYTGEWSNGKREGKVICFESFILPCKIEVLIKMQASQTKNRKFKLAQAQ
jgi:hypothetical protein